MSVLGIYFNNIGQAGQNPQFVYIDTDETVAQITAAGFLNKFVIQGEPFNESLMAVVTTKTTPSAKNIDTGLYNITFSDGNWSLTPLTSQILLPQSNMFLGNDAGVAQATSVGGVIKFFDQVLTSGGSTSLVIPIPGIDPSLDAAFTSISEPGSNSAIILAGSVTIDQLTITFNVDPGNDCLFHYFILRVPFFT